MRRYTSVRIAIYSMILQSLVSLGSFATYVHAYWPKWALLDSTYPIAQRSLWLTALLWSAVSLVCGVAMLRGRAWGRMSYACGAILSLTVFFSVSPWALALSAVPIVALTIGVLYSRRGTQFLTDAAVHSATPNARARGAAICFALSIVLLYMTYVSMFTQTGWMHRRFPDNSPLDFMEVSCVLLVAGTWASARGMRMWQCGVALMVFVVVTSSAFLGYLPYAPVLAHYLGPAYRSYALPWSLVNFSLIIVGAVATVMLRLNRPARPSKEPLVMPDYQ